MDIPLTTTNLALFIPAALALLLTPGPAVLYIVALFTYELARA